MRLILEVTSGPLKGKQIEAKVGETVRVGRISKADVAMEDSFMSGEHFAIECNSRSCRLRDLNSRNGTQLNGKMITEAYLTDGDQVYAGKTDFKVRIEDFPKTVAVSPAEQEAMRSEPAKSAPPPAPQRKQSKKLPPVSVPQPAPPAAISPNPPTTSKDVPPAPAASRNRDFVDERHPQQAPHTVANKPVVPTKTELKRVAPSPPPAASPPPRPEVVSQNALETYEAATPEGRLIHILSSQSGSLMALVDAVHDGKLLDLIRGFSKAFHSLYRSEQNATIAPYLVALPPRSELLKQMVQQGWGHEWGVYLTSPLSLLELREFFRTSLMVTMPDGMELFSRFYDPRFFRSFLETCTAPEAEKFFGPITSYFMEDERSEILLQFSRSKRGAEKKGHLLSVLV
ncbi:MAG TPA: hypothetical protein DCK93_20100 [Blastocatellia bacterium]|jgi:pSer/pThr/pTyr-binding forkhead associated (FHA) protein|nr:hypothetical protein [Blastocatellia bacterium]